MQKLDDSNYGINEEIQFAGGAVDLPSNKQAFLKDVSS